MGCGSSKMAASGNHHSVSGNKRGSSRIYLAFLSHDWAKDQLGRDNHARVRDIFRALRRHGIQLWFDEEYMQGDIDKAMCKGIDESDLVVIFITKRYMHKVAGDDEQDNCQKEFNYAKMTHGPAKTLAVVMEPQCRDTNTWPGQVKMYQGSRLYFDFADDDNFDSKIEQLKNLLLNTAGRSGEAVSTADATIDAAPASAPAGAAGAASLESDVMALLRKFDLDDADTMAILLREGIRTKRRLLQMLDDDVAHLGLPRVVERDFKQMLEEEKALQAARAAEVAAAAAAAAASAAAADFESKITFLQAQQDFASLVSGMQTFAMIPVIQQNALEALKSLAANANNKVKIAAEGGVKSILEAMSNHRTHAGIQEQGCWALRNLAGNANNLTKMKNLGAEASITTSMQSSTATPTTKQKGQELFDLLKNL